MTEHFDSVKSMINNLRSEDPEERLTSMRGIHLIASTLGPERTRDELLPYLTDYLDENEVVLRVFANALGTMLQEVGGADHLQSILTPLELLSSLDEITVRDEAVTSLQTIGGQVFRETGEAAAQAQRDFLDLVYRLGKATTQCRSSASYLIATAYPHVSTAIKGQLMSLFIELCNDKEIMDKFDAVRLQTVEAAAALLKALPYELHANVFSSIKALMSDYSWRVRHMAADRLGKLAEAMSPTEVKNILPFFRSLSQDAEAEIRASAVFSMASLLAVFRDPSAKRELLTAGCRLVNDENAHVRMCLASAVLRSVAHVAKELWATTIVPTCTQLLKDQEADVRLALVSGFSSMGNTSEAREMAPKLVPVVVALAGDPNWRIREVVISQVPFLITSLGKNAEDVVELCVQHLVDRVATIREAAVRSCCTLVAENGTAWSRASLFPRLSSMASTNNYLHRVALAHFYASLASVQSLDCGTASQHILPMLRLFAQDSVPNVRLNCAKALLALKKGRRLLDSDTEPLISRLRKDADVDVRFVASED